MELSPRQLVIVALALFLISSGLFGWASLGWLEPNMERRTAGHSSLIFYTNQPDSVNEARLELFPEGDRGLQGILSIDFGGISDSSEFRWALVGQGSMKFSAEMETEGRTTGDVGGIVERTMKIPPPRPFTLGCQSGSTSSNDQSVLIGGLNRAALLGTDGYERVSPGELLTKIHFAEVDFEREGDAYGWTLNLGYPTNENAVRLGPLIAHVYDDCVDFGGGEEVQGIKELSATPLPWSVGIEGAAKSDAVLHTYPVGENPRRADWKVTELTELEVLFADASRYQARQAAVFLAGVLSGLAGGIVVLAAFKPPGFGPEPSDSWGNSPQRSEAEASSGAPDTETRELRLRKGKRRGRRR